MKRLSALIATAQIERRLLWASLPFQTRLAELLFRLAVDSKEAFGRAIYTIFVKQKVQGMPDIKGLPAEMYDLDRSPGHMVPPGYGKDFGRIVWVTFVRKWKGDVELVQDAMQNVVLSLSKRPDGYLREGSTLSEAQKYVLSAVYNAGNTIYKTRKKRPSDYGLTPPEVLEPKEEWGGEGESREVDYSDPKALSTLMEEVSRNRLMPALIRELNRIPGATEYVEGVIDTGLPDIQLVGDYRKGIPAVLPYFQEHPISVQGFEQGTKTKLRKVLRKYINEMLDVAA